jgi:hypothetical protein
MLKNIICGGFGMNEIYTKRELKLHKDGFQDLAKEIIWQWKADGMPKSDFSGIKLWADFLRSHAKMQEGEYKLWQK